MNNLIPLRDAARRLGLSPKTVRNHAAHARAGLPGWHLPLVKLGERLFVRSSDLDAFLSSLGDVRHGPQREIEIIADTIAAIFPDESNRLRALAAVIPSSTQRSRKPGRGAGLRAVENAGNAQANERTS